MNTIRDSYDALNQVPPRAKQLLRDAQTAKVVPSEYAEFDRKGRGHALNIDFYAVSRDGIAAIVQLRRYERTKTNWFPRIKKTYKFIFDRDNNGNIFSLDVTAQRVRRAVNEWQDDPEAALRVLTPTVPGLFAHLSEAPTGARTPQENSVATERGYKLVALVNEALVSVYDRKTEYKIGKRLTEKARDNHSGGYYFYRDIEKTRGVAELDIAKWTSEFAIIEVEVSGTFIEYGEKIAATYMRPIRVIETFKRE